MGREVDGEEDTRNTKCHSSLHLLRGSHVCTLPTSGGRNTFRGVNGVGVGSGKRKGEHLTTIIKKKEECCEVGTGSQDGIFLRT